MTEDEFSRIFQYLNNRATEEERAQLEQRLAEDAEFEQAFQETRRGLLVVDFAGMLEMQDRAKKLQEDRKEGPSVLGIPSKWMIYGLVGTILLLVITITWRYWHHASMEDLFTEYFQPAELPSTTRSSTSPGFRYWNKATAEYLEKDYEEATALFGEVMTESQGSDAEAEFFMAVSRLSSGKSLDLAIGQLDEISKSGGPQAVQAKWFLALAYIRSKNKISAQEVLTSIAKDGNSPYKSKATKLMKEL